jgi:hypothetical protein
MQLDLVGIFDYYFITGSQAPVHFRNAAPTTINALHRNVE